ADDRGGDGDSGRRAVLGDRALGHVDVDVQVTVEVLRQAKISGARTHVTHRRLRRFLHDIAQLAGERQPALAFHQRSLGAQHLPADLGPGKPGGQADLIVLLGPDFAELDDAEVVLDIRGGDLDLDFPAFSHHLARDLPGDVGNFALQVAYAGLVRVVP